MAFLRLFAVWVLVATVPLQSIAARAMFFCAASGSPESISEAEVLGEHASHAHDHASSVSRESASSEAAVEVANFHKCSLCASCCHALGLPEELSVEAGAALTPQAFPPVVLPAVVRPPTRLERPPRI